MEQDTPTRGDQSDIQKYIYLIAAFAAGALIVYGALFYAGDKRQEAQVSSNSLPKQEGEINKADINFNEPFLGDVDAPVTMIEYGGYLCGHCLAFGRDTFPKIEENYIETGKVKFIYRSFPPFQTGMALGCAFEQGKYWDYHHYLVENNLTAEEDLITFAGQVGMDTEKLSACLESEKYIKLAETWYQLGQDAGVEGTPTFFINGKKVVGNLPYADFAGAIEEALSKAQIPGTE